MIPKDIYICYKNLKELQEYSQIWKELNPEYTLHLYDDQMCIDFLEKEYSSLHANIFKYIPDGPIKADFWRVCILYRYGGLYVDADIEPIIPLREYVDETVDFMSCLSDHNINWPYNPHIIMTYAKNKLLKKCIDTYTELYNNNKPYNYWDWSIVNILKDTMTNMSSIIKQYIYIYNNEKFQFLQEVEYNNNSYYRFCTYNNKKVLNNNFKSYDMLSHHFINIENNIIPTIIHNNLPIEYNISNEKLYNIQNMWKQFYPHWNYKLWNYNEMDKFIYRKYNKYHRKFHSSNNKVDIVKYFILYENGGLWTNIDYICTKNYEYLFNDNKVTILYDISNISNLVIISPKKHIFWEYVIEYVLDTDLVQFFQIDITNIINIAKMHTTYCIIKNINEC
jgi:mannosyltransferase OCH1-like enzyme